MSPISPFAPAALQILRQGSLSPASSGGAGPAGESLVAVANGLAGAGSPGVGQRSAQAKISEALFSAQTSSIHQMKINLMQRLGEAFGVSSDDFHSQAAFGSRIKDIVAEIERQDDGFLVLAKIERKLGLDKLGISLDTLIEAVIDPDSRDGERLDAALRRHLGEDGPDDAKDDARGVPAWARIDALGLYGARG